MHLSTRRPAVAALALSAALLVGAGVSGCSSSSGKSAAGAASASGTPAGPSSGTTGSSTGPSTTTGGSSSSPAGSASPTATASATSGTEAGGCQDLTATASVKAAVVSAYEAKNPGLTDIVPAPGNFYYGSCGGTQYAATNFTAGPGAPQNTLVAMQDDGSTRKYFAFAATGWSYVNSDSFPDRGGCAAQIPADLAKAWNNCPSPH